MRLDLLPIHSNQQMMSQAICLARCSSSPHVLPQQDARIAKAATYHGALKKCEMRNAQEPHTQMQRWLGCTEGHVPAASMVLLTCHSETPASPAGSLCKVYAVLPGRDQACCPGGAKYHMRLIGAVPSQTMYRSARDAALALYLSLYTANSLIGVTIASRSRTAACGGRWHGLPHA